MSTTLPQITSPGASALNTMAKMLVEIEELIGRRDYVGARELSEAYRALAEGRRQL